MNDGTVSILGYARDLFDIGTQIDIPSTIETCIENYAFMGFSDLSNITFPESVTWIVNFPFEE